MKEQNRKTTKQRITDAAIDIFCEHWYDSISVAEICRKAGVSNGIFYKYFYNKEDLYKDILNDFLVVFKSHFRVLTGSTVRDRLEAFFSLLLDSDEEDRKLIDIFREGEFRYPEYEKKLRLIYKEALANVFGREINEAEYLYIVGGVRFLVRRPAYKKEKVTPDELVRIVLNGLFDCRESMSEKYLDIKKVIPEDESSGTVKEKLLLAGLQLFGKHGYYSVNVYEIAREADYSVGTFYSHFKSKAEFLTDVVSYIGKSFRRFIKRNIDPDLNRIETELQGYLLFLEYFSTHIANYQIVREAEFAAKKAADEYYRKLEEGYMRNLNCVPVISKAVAADYLLGIGHHLGIEYFFCNSIKDINSILKDLGKIFRNGVLGS